VSDAAVRAAARTAQLSFDLYLITDLTLGINLVAATDAALRAVPRDLREAALALGATRFQSILSVVLPNARGGILTGVVLAVSRGAGGASSASICSSSTAAASSARRATTP